MATKPQGEEIQQIADGQQEGIPAVAGWGDKIGAAYERVKENVQTYRYVWASYIVVYGGFGLWFTYRWRKLRRTEDNVRYLQAKLRRIIEEENAAESSAVSEKPMVNPIVVPQEPTNYAVIEEKPANSAAVPKRPTNSSAIPKKASDTTSLTDRRPHANKATK